MTRPSFASQAAAARLAVRQAATIAKAAGLRGVDQVGLLREQLGAAADTLDRLAAIRVHHHPDNDQTSAALNRLVEVASERMVGSDRDG